MKNHIESAWKLQKNYEKKGVDYNEDLFCVQYRNDVDGFDVVELEIDIPDEILTERENYWIEYYDSIKNGYNKVKMSKQNRNYFSDGMSWFKPQKENKNYTCEACLENQYYLENIDECLPPMCKECYVKNRYL